MRKVANGIMILAALAVCALMTYLTLNSGKVTVIYNVSVLGIMLLIIFFAWIFGFLRMGRTVRSLKKASRKLMAVYKDRSKLSEITRSGAELFEITYLDQKYQEYLGYLRRTNSPADIGDYVGDIEIANYTHRRMVELVPDILTSLGILGTFMGLVWGLQGFDPVSYEAMATSITSLVDGIKVAFVTSIYGISLSVAYSFCLRGAVTELAESLDDFTDKYYLVAVPPTDATAMNHVLANQKEEIKALQNLTTEVAEQLSLSMTEHMTPVMNQMGRTLDNFTRVVTLQQQELLENIGAQLVASMQKEFASELAEMKNLLRDTNRAQEDALDHMAKAQSQFEANYLKGKGQLELAMKDTSALWAQSGKALEDQRNLFAEFAAYMNESMGAMADLQKETKNFTEAVTKQMSAMEEMTRRALAYANAAGKSASSAEEAAERAEEPVRRTKVDDIDELTERMDQMVLLLQKLERAQREKKKGIFR